MTNRMGMIRKSKDWMPTMNCISAEFSLVELSLCGIELSLRMSRIMVTVATIVVSMVLKYFWLKMWCRGKPMSNMHKQATQWDRNIVCMCVRVEHFTVSLCRHVCGCILAELTMKSDIDNWVTLVVVHFNMLPTKGIQDIYLGCICVCVCVHFILVGSERCVSFRLQKCSTADKNRSIFCVL